ncbi:MAG: hypothetical protein AAF654_04715 [Myxococcota bacterium]
MTRALLCLFLVGCGLDDPAVFDLSVSFDGAGEPRMGNASRFELEVYLPGASAANCDTLANGTSELSAAVEIRLADRSNPELTSLPRSGRKLVVIRGIDENDIPVVAGCAEVGDVDGDAELRIDAEPTTRAALTLIPSEGVETFARWSVEIRDARGELRPELSARWESLGAGQFTPFSEQVGESLEFELLEDPPPGPLRVTVLTRWALEASTQVVFVPPRERVFAQPPASAQFAVVSKEITAVLGAYVLSSGETEVVAYGAGSPSSVRIAGSWGIVEQRDSAFVFSETEIVPVEFSEAGLLIGDRSSLPTGVVQMPARAFDASTCDPDSNTRAIVFSSAGGNRVLDSTLLTELPSIGVSDEVTGSGCVRDGDEVMRRAFTTGAALWIESSEGAYELVPATSTAFRMDFVGQQARLWAEPGLAITSLAERTALIQPVLNVSMEGGLGIGVQESVLGVPLAVEAADADGSSVSDLLSIIRFDNQSQALFVILLGQDGNSTAAPFVLDGVVNEPWFTVVDLNPNDGRPDIVVADRAPDAESSLRILSIGPALP